MAQQKTFDHPPGPSGGIVCYLRVSTDEQTDSGHGLHAQEDACKRWISAQSLPVLAWCSDEGVSGAAPLDRRPGLTNAITKLPHGGILLIAKRDRLARDTMVLAMVEAMIRRKKGRIVSVAGEGTDGDSPSSVLMRRMVDAFAEYERLIIKARTKAALQAKIARGEKIGGQHAPYGFRVVMRGEVKHLEPDPTEQANIQVMRQLRQEGLSFQRIAAVLAERGIHTKTGKVWRRVDLWELLNRP